MSSDVCLNRIIVVRHTSCGYFFGIPHRSNSSSFVFAFGNEVLNMMNPNSVCASEAIHVASFIFETHSIDQQVL